MNIYLLLLYLTAPVFFTEGTLFWERFGYLKVYGFLPGTHNCCILVIRKLGPIYVTLMVVVMWCVSRVYVASYTVVLKPWERKYKTFFLLPFFIVPYHHVLLGFSYVYALDRPFFSLSYFSPPSRKWLCCVGKRKRKKSDHIVVYNKVKSLAVWCWVSLHYCSWSDVFFFLLSKLNFF